MIKEEYLNDCNTAFMKQVFPKFLKPEALAFEKRWFPCNWSLTKAKQFKYWIKREILILLHTFLLIFCFCWFSSDPFFLIREGFKFCAVREQFSGLKNVIKS